MTTQDQHAPPAEKPGLFQRFWLGIPLWRRILTALFIGAVVGLVLGEHAVAVKWIGDIFVRLTRMVVAPLVFFTITAGVIALADPRKLGSLGARTLGLFALTAGLGATLGATLGLLFRPGQGVDVTGAAPEIIRSSKTLSEQLLGIIPLNPIQALAEGDMLAMIFFAIVFAAGVLAMGPRGRPLGDMLTLASEAMMHIIRFVIEIAPFGVFGLVAAAVGANGPGVFVNVSLLALAVVIGCGIQVLVIDPTIIRLLARLSGMAFLRKTVDVMLVGFSTSSSSASLPVEMAVAEKNLGINGTIRATVLPIGVSVARNGTALYVALLSVFAAQALGLELRALDVVLVVVVSTLIALSAPPAPSASLFMMAAVLSVLGIDDARSALIVGFILPFDRPLDMIRTVPNVIGNLVNATVVARWSGQIDMSRWSSSANRDTSGAP